MTCDEAMKQFKTETGANHVKWEAFSSVFRELTDKKPHGDGFTDVDAISLMCEWYESASHMQERSPLDVIQTYRRPRAWVVFLAWEENR